ncbi:MAG: hypothetical protein AAGO57_05545, partial [Pseudomonadota bacterium]
AVSTPGSDAMDDPDNDMGSDDMEMGEDHGDHTMPPETDGEFTDISEFGTFHGSSSHTMDHALHGGRTPITTEALDAYNGLRDFLGLNPVGLETIGQWAFDNTLTNNTEAYGEDLKGVGLFYGMQGAKVGWIADEKFDPQILADIQRTARLGEEDDVMTMVESFGHDGFAEYLETEGLVETFVNTLKMEPHYGGWMHGRTHGWLPIDGEDGNPVAIAHDINHLTVLSHDQTQPFMNDTFDWPQWPALEVPEEDVIDYFQSMVLLSNPRGDGIEAAGGFMSIGGEEFLAMLTIEAAEDDGQPVDEEELLEPIL